MRDRLQSGQDLVLCRAEGIDEDVSICRFGGFVEDGDGGEAGGGQEGEVCRRGAGAADRGGFGLEVEAYEAVLETPAHPRQCRQKVMTADQQGEFEKCIPIEERPNHQSRPRQPLPLFTLHILPYLHLPPIHLRQRLRRLQLRHIRAELTQYNPLHPCFNRRIDNRLVRGDFSDGSHVDDSILVFESGDEFIEGVGVGDAVDFDVGWEGGFRRGAGEDFDVACEAGVGVEGGEDGGTEVAGGLRGVVRYVN